VSDRLRIWQVDCGLMDPILSLSFERRELENLFTSAGQPLPRCACAPLAQSMVLATHAACHERHGLLANLVESQLDVIHSAAIDQLDEEGPGPLLHPLWEGRGVVGDLAGRLWALATWGDPLAKELVPQVRATISLAAWCELGARISRERTQLFDR